MVSPALPRRSFLARLTAGTAAFGAAFAADVSVARAADAPAKPDELDLWFGGMHGPNKAIFDCTNTPAASSGVMFARNLMKFSTEKLGTRDAEMSVVVCFRHFATPFGYNDAMWAKYPQFGEMLQADDPSTKKRAARNWMLHQAVEGQDGADLPGLRGHGVSFAICAAATDFLSGILAGAGGDAKAIAAELGANLIPGGRLVAAGIVAVQRAQKAGFAYTYAG